MEPRPYIPALCVARNAAGNEVVWVTAQCDFLLVLHSNYMYVTNMYRFRLRIARYMGSNIASFTCSTCIQRLSVRKLESPHCHAAFSPFRRTAARDGPTELLYQYRALYRQHCAQRKPPVFNLLRGRFWGFSPRATRCTVGGEIWRGGGVPSSTPNFTPIGATTRV